MFLGLVNESFWIKKKNQVKDNASCENEIRRNSFPFTIWKYRQERICFLVWLMKVYGLKKKSIQG